MVLDDIVLEFQDFSTASKEYWKIEKNYDLARKPTLMGGSQADGSVKWKVIVHNPSHADYKDYTIQRLARLAIDYDKVRRDYRKRLSKDGQ